MLSEGVEEAQVHTGVYPRRDGTHDLGAGSVGQPEFPAQGVVLDLGSGHRADQDIPRELRSTTPGDSEIWYCVTAVDAAASDEARWMSTFDGAGRIQSLRESRAYRAGQVADGAGEGEPDSW